MDEEEEEEEEEEVEEEEEEEEEHQDHREGEGRAVVGGERTREGRGSLSRSTR